MRLEPEPLAITPLFDGSGTAEAIAAGERAMDDAMPELARLLA